MKINMSTYENTKGKDLSFLGKADSYRYSNKRNSHDIIRSTNSSKNSKQSKKPLPQVRIDLNNKIKKSINKNHHNNFNKLTINHQSYHSNRNNNNIDKNCNNPNNFYKNTNGSNISNSRQLHTLNSTLNKSKISQNNLPIHFVQNNTQPLRRQKQSQINQRNQRGVSNYREEISQLRMENQCLREQNLTLRKNQQYLIEELREAKQAKKLQQKANASDKELIKQLRKKIVQYGDKIQQLYKQLIHQKEKRVNKNENTINNERKHQKLSIEEMQQQENQQIQAPSQKNQKGNEKKLNIRLLNIYNSQQEKDMEMNQQMDNILSEDQFQNFDSENIKREMRLLKMKQEQKEQKEMYFKFKNASDSAILMNKKKNGVFCNYNKQNQYEHSNSLKSSKVGSKKSPRSNQGFLIKPPNSNFEALNQYYINMQKYGQKAYEQQKNQDKDYRQYQFKR